MLDLAREGAEERACPRIQLKTFAHGIRVAFGCDAYTAVAYSIVWNK